jgi:hypothetical protein
MKMLNSKNCHWKHIIQRKFNKLKRAAYANENDTHILTYAGVLAKAMSWHDDAPASDTMLAVHSVHAVAPAVMLNVSTAHDAQTDEPMDAANVPAAHACGADEPAVAQAEPGWQTSGPDAPEDGQYEPTPQAVHTDVCVCGAKEPGAHGTGALAPAALVK